MSNEPKPCTAVITALSLKYDGFAVVRGTEESIYIPPKVAKASSLVPGAIRTVHILPNFQEKADTTQWLGVYVAPSNANEPLQQALYENLLESPEVYMTTAELATVSGASEQDVSAAMGVLWADRRVAKADVYEGPAQPAVAQLWAVSVKDFCEWQ